VKNNHSVKDNNHDNINKESENSKMPSLKEPINIITEKKSANANININYNLYVDINTNLSSNTFKIIDNNYNKDHKSNNNDINYNNNKEKEKDIKSNDDILSNKEKIKENYIENLANWKRNVSRIEFKKQVADNKSEKQKNNLNKKNKEHQVNEYKDNDYQANNMDKNNNIKILLPSEIKLNQIRLISFLRGSCSRLKLKRNILDFIKNFYKIELKNGEEISKKYLYKINNILNIEKKYNLFDEKGWNKIYSSKEKFQDMQILYEIPIIDFPILSEKDYSRYVTIGEINTENNEFFYKGILNETKELEGFGILFQGNKKYEGIFIGNKLNGWGRIISKDDFMEEGIFILKDNLYRFI
jgi:hypothetical protein